MTYGASKERDMVRSILPSTSRKGARDDKRFINKRCRNRVRQALHQYRGEFAAEAYVDPEDDDGVELDRAYVEVHEADHEYKRQIKYAMWDRREADKVAPIIRWAKKKVQDIRPEDRLSWLQARMPDNLAVRHAVSHIKYSDAFPIENPYEYGWRQYYRMTDEERAWVAAAEYAQVHEDIKKVLIYGYLDQFNRHIPRYAERSYTHHPRGPVQLPEPWELIQNSWTRRFVWRAEVQRLKGLHDIDDFIARSLLLIQGYSFKNAVRVGLYHALKAAGDPAFRRYEDVRDLPSWAR